MPQDASMGWEGRLSMAAPGTAIGSYAEAYEFLGESLRNQNEILDTNGITGSRSHKSERTRFGLNRISGGIQFNPSPLMLVNLLPRILGANASGTTFALADTLPAFDVLLDRIVQRWVYGNCVVNRAVFKGSVGQLLTLDIDLRGKTASKSATSFPSITNPVDPPYVNEDCVISLLSSNRQVMGWELTIDNALDVRFSGERNASAITPTDRIVTLKLTTPWTSDESDLHGQALSGSAATITAAVDNYSLVFSMPALQFPDADPVVAQRNGKLVYELTGTARMSGTSKELVVTNDSTP